MTLLKSLALSDTGFVFNPGTGDSFSVNPIGLEIMKLLREGHAHAEIREKLHTAYQADRETIEKDLYDFVKMMEQLKLTDHEA